jgi:hypothetical protein
MCLVGPQAFKYQLKITKHSNNTAMSSIILTKVIKHMGHFAGDLWKKSKTKTGAHTYNP